MDKMGTPEPTDASFQVMGPKKYILEESTNYWGTAELDGKFLSLGVQRLGFLSCSTIYQL